MQGLGLVSSSGNSEINHRHALKMPQNFENFMLCNYGTGCVYEIIGDIYLKQTSYFSAP
jgi:hypothetical protein